MKRLTFRLLIILFLTLAGLSGCTWIYGSLTRTDYGSNSGCAATPTHSRYQSGSGTTSDPYVICTAEQWNKIGLNQGDWASTFKLGANINLSSLSSYNGIGTAAVPFTGAVNGASFAISGLTSSVTGVPGGLFSVVDNSTFTQLTLRNFTLSSNQSVGGLAGSVVSGSTVTGSNIAVDSVTITQCTNGGGLFGDVIGQATLSSVSVNNLTISATSSPPSGLGGTIGKLSGVTANTTLDNVSVNFTNLGSGGFCGYAGGIVGGIVGTTQTLSISNSRVQSSNPSTCGGTSRGGIVGGVLVPTTINLTLQNTTANLSFNAWPSPVGGLVGQILGFGNGNVIISQSSFTGSLTSSTTSAPVGGAVASITGNLSFSLTSVAVYAGSLTNTAGFANPIDVGGLVGLSNSATGTNSISDSYARGSLSATVGNSVGGALGTNVGDNWTIQRIYFAGSVAAAAPVGCIVGSNGGLITATDVYYDISTCSSGNGLAGVTAQNTALMQPATAFTNWANGLWIFSLGVYPRLSWE